MRGERIIDEWILRQETVEKSKKYYAHFDARTDMKKAANLVTDAEWVSHHGFYPLIHYKKDCSKYSRKGRKQKERDICYAAHLDRCILQYYCHVMNERYNTRIRDLGIEDVPVAYRSDLRKGTRYQRCNPYAGLPVCPPLTKNIKENTMKYVCRRIPLYFREAV